MSKYRTALPQLQDKIFLTDGGLETTLIFHQGIDLPCFASFTLLDTPEGRKSLSDYYASYAGMAKEAGLGFILDTATWRANADWGAKLGYDAAALDDVNRRSIEFLAGIRDRFETARSPFVISGAIGPRGDGYVADQKMSVEEARDYHMFQLESFARAGADMATAFTMNYVEEAIGIVLAAAALDLPISISFTVETDGRLPTGISIGEAIETVDKATLAAPIYYMINCAHPTHFAHLLDPQAGWAKRIRGIRANSSKRSHAELDAAPDLDAGDPVELGRQYRALRDQHSQITVLGGCCGTDCRHVEQIRLACLAA